MTAYKKATGRNIICSCLLLFMSVMILPCHLFQHRPDRITNCLYPSSRYQPLFSSSAIQPVLSSDTARFRVRYGLYQASIRAVSYRRSRSFRTPYGLYLPAGPVLSVRTAFSSALRQSVSCRFCALLSTSELQVLRIFELYAVIVSSCLFLRCPRQ